MPTAARKVQFTIAVSTFLLMSRASALDPIITKSTIDFRGYNLYSWCAENTLSGSGYDKQVDFSSNHSVPVSLAEYGCNVPDGAEGRLFQDTTALYSNDMSKIFSGGIAYMYYQEENDYGLVEIKDGKAETMKNYNILSSEVLKATPSSISADSYDPTNTPANCPELSSSWVVNSKGLSPTPDRDLCECMHRSVSCAPSSRLNTSEYGEIFGFVCAESPSVCAGINTNTTTGVYGAYSMCNNTHKLAYVMDAYYLDQKSVRSAYDHDGKAEIISTPSTAPSCKSKLDRAATATAAATGSSGVAGSGNGQSFGIANHRVQNVFSLGDIGISLYLAVATMIGESMIMLNKSLGPSHPVIILIYWWGQYHPLHTSIDLPERGQLHVAA
ncbi:1,3-beta-glucanosyltransferase gas1 [Alternaria alternata]|nr:1,3-beta-glucanosyltransferase gas1 [Alternaria alternata]